MVKFQVSWCEPLPWGEATSHQPDMDELQPCQDRKMNEQLSCKSEQEITSANFCAQEWSATVWRIYQTILATTVKVKTNMRTCLDRQVPSWCSPLPGAKQCQNVITVKPLHSTTFVKRLGYTSFVGNWYLHLTVQSPANRIQPCLQCKLCVSICIYGTKCKTHFCNYMLSKKPRFPDNTGQQ